MAMGFMLAVGTLLTGSAAVIHPGEDVKAAIQSAISAKAKEVVVADGLYRIGETVTLDAAAAGLTIRAEHPGRAKFVGGWTFRGKDLRPVKGAPLAARLMPEVAGKALCVTVPEAEREALRARPHPNRVCAKALVGEMPPLTMDGVALRPAQWPNGRAFMWIDKENCPSNNAVISTQTGREARWTIGPETDVFAYGSEGNPFAVVKRRIVGKAGPYVKSSASFNPGVAGYARYRFCNVLEELDEPGEWCLDRVSGLLALIPPTGFSPDSVFTAGTAAFPFFVAEKADGIRFEGLAFEGKITAPCVSLRGLRNGAVERCTFSSVGTGVDVLDCRDSAVRGCSFDHCSGPSVCIRRCGSIRTLTPGNVTVEDCTFREWEGTAICFPHWDLDDVLGDIRSFGCSVRHCDFADADGHAMDLFGNDLLVEYCRVRNVSRELHDSGAIYTSGCNSYGTVIRYNDVGAAPGLVGGVYLDDFTCGVTVYGNVVRDCGYYGIVMGGGRNNRIENNVVLNCWGGVRTDNRGLYWDAWKDKKRFWAGATNALGAAYLAKHPEVARWWEADGTNRITAPIGNTYRNNVFVDLPGYSDLIFIAYKRGIRPEDNVCAGNVAYRRTGLRPGADDMAAGESSVVRTNRYSATYNGGPEVFRPMFPVKVVDGTPEKPVDPGFVKIPGPAYDPSAYMFAMQGWIDEPGFHALGAKGAYLNLAYGDGDFALKSGARVLTDVPGFEPIPWAKIGVRGAAK